MKKNKNNEADSGLFGESGNNDSFGDFSFEQSAQDGGNMFGEVPSSESNMFESVPSSESNAFDITSSNEGNMFDSVSSSESNMFSEGSSEDNAKGKKSKKNKKNKKKNKVKPFIIIGVIVALLAALVIALPIVFVKIGDSHMANGDYEKAASFYKLCFGTNGSTKRLGAANATSLIEKGETEEGINMLLDNGIAVNVKYDLNGGSFINSDRKTEVTLKDKAEFGDLYKARKDYYSFEKWDLLSYSYAPDYDDTVFDVSLKANYVLNSYKISYTNLFSETVENPQEYTYETSTITLKNPSRDGYKFLYWKGTDINGESATVVIPQGSHGDRAYIANWEPNKYVVTMNPDVDCFIENPMTVTYDDSYKLPDIEKRGYTHRGWSDGKDTFFEGIWTTLYDVSVTPVWEINNYKLTYDLAGGAVATENPATYTVTSDDIAIVEPTRHGYTFQGWLHSGKQYAEKNVVIKNNSIGDIDFTAVWLGNPHKLSLDAAGGYVTPSVMNVVYGSNYSIPTPSRRGYRFDGWYNGSTKYSAGTWDQDNDLKVTATWTPNKYNVSLNANGGIVSKTSLTATYDAAYQLPVPTRYGYTFNGWFSGNNFFNTAGTWNAISDVTLVAGWKGNPHVITLNTNGGTVPSKTVNVVFGNNYSIPTPVKTGHTFAGWLNGSSGVPATGKWEADNDVTLSAKWTVNPYDARLNPAGGSVSRSVVTTNYGSSYSLPSPSRTGYTFQGWYNGTSRIENNGTWIWDKHLDLSASWAPKKYSLSFDANGGSLSLSRLEVTYDAAYRLPVPKMKGYTFKGWYNGSTKYTDGVWKIDGGVSLKASWQVNTYEAILDVNGGDISRVSIKCEYGSNYSFPTPTRKGYTFEGWFNEDSDEMSSSGKWIWDEDLVVFAEWDPIDYIVSLSPNGGDVSDTRIEVTFDKKYTLPTPTRVGYNFVGWYSGNTKYANSGRWSVANNVSLTAVWEIREYLIALDANGGSVSRDEVIAEYGDYYSLPIPTRTGYTFVGWYSGSTKIPESGTWRLDEDVALKAKWEANSYTIYLYDLGQRITVTYGQSYSLPTPSDSGRRFLGWYYGGTKYPNSGKWTGTENITLTAKWEQVEIEYE